jgi:hypothetical protein
MATPKKTKNNPETVRAYFLKNKKAIYAYQSDWKKQNRDKCREYARRHGEKYPEKKELKNFKSKMHGLSFEFSLDEYKKLLAEQKGVCAICGEKDPKRALSIDHCHNSNKVRGLLCKKCNSGLGFFRDIKDIVVSAVKYLKKYDS